MNRSASTRCGRSGEAMGQDHARSIGAFDACSFTERGLTDTFKRVPLRSKPRHLANAFVTGRRSTMNSSSASFAGRRGDAMSELRDAERMLEAAEQAAVADDLASGDEL